MSNTGDGTQPAEQVQEPRDRWWTRLIRYVKRKTHERRAKKQEETSADRAARRTANATIWMDIFTVILAFISIGTLWILKNQLREMHEGGIDTHALAEATGKMKDSADRNATAAEGFATSAGLINTGIGDAIKKLDAQAKATQIAANAAQQQSRTIATELQATYRPWVTIESVVPTQPIQNTGRGSIILTAKFRLRNIGNVPAMSAIFDVEGVEFNPQGPWSDTASEDFCKTITQYRIQHFSIFPGETPTREKQVAIPRDRVNANFGIFEPGIIACVAYKSTIDNDWHYTGRVYKISKTSELWSMFGVFNTNSLPIPADQLTIEPMPYPDVAR